MIRLNENVYACRQIQNNNNNNHNINNNNNVYVYGHLVINKRMSKYKEIRQ